MLNCLQYSFVNDKSDLCENVQQLRLSESNGFKRANIGVKQTTQTTHFDRWQHCCHVPQAYFEFTKTVSLSLKKTNKQKIYFVFVQGCVDLL